MTQERAKLEHLLIKAELYAASWLRFATPGLSQPLDVAKLATDLTKARQALLDAIEEMDR